MEFPWLGRGLCKHDEKIKWTASAEVKHKVVLQVAKHSQFLNADYGLLAYFDFASCQYITENHRQACLKMLGPTRQGTFPLALQGNPEEPQVGVLCRAAGLEGLC